MTRSIFNRSNYSSLMLTAVLAFSARGQLVERAVRPHNEGMDLDREGEVVEAAPAQSDPVVSRVLSANPALRPLAPIAWRLTGSLASENSFG
jgi:hypothetical protein